ncbi:MAG: hypothetical protein Q9219_005046 [cf. Caloplaca sp. 3 TL-2023]
MSRSSLLYAGLEIVPTPKPIEEYSDNSSSNNPLDCPIVPRSDGKYGADDSSADQGRGTSPGSSPPSPGSSAAQRTGASVHISASAQQWHNLPISVDLANPNNDVPSSSGPFTPVVLLPGWQAYPSSPGQALQRPVKIPASLLEIFYKQVLEYCGQLFWSNAPFRSGFRLVIGAFVITVAGDSKGTGLPWAVLALLAQGMLERARR